MPEKASCLSPQQIEAVLRERGVQPTAQRIVIGRYVLCEANHPTAEEVKAWVDQNFPKISLATVYNTLNAFVEAGLLKELRIPERGAVVFDSNTAHHHHFLDESSGEVHDLDPGLVHVAVDLGPEFQIHNATVFVRGTRAADIPPSEKPA
ncbi:MAG: Fur family transcriptional regulator [Candidatus Sericytochromatia bacterium]|nr:Fur family transcriptional regulator [Candidatus Sericytochromatia bacterium]